MSVSIRHHQKEALVIVSEAPHCFSRELPLICFAIEGIEPLLSIAGSVLTPPEESCPTEPMPQAIAKGEVDIV